MQSDAWAKSICCPQINCGEFGDLLLRIRSYFVAAMGVITEFVFVSDPKFELPRLEGLGGQKTPDREIRRCSLDLA